MDDHYHIWIIISINGWSFPSRDDHFHRDMINSIKKWSFPSMDDQFHRKMIISIMIISWCCFSPDGRQCWSALILHQWVVSPEKTTQVGTNISIPLLGQIRFTIWTNIFHQSRKIYFAFLSLEIIAATSCRVPRYILDKYVLQFGRIHLKNLTNTFVKSDKYNYRWAVTSRGSRRTSWSCPAAAISSGFQWLWFSALWLDFLILWLLFKSTFLDDFFRAVLADNQNPHPLIYMRGTEAKVLASVVAFIYHGQVINYCTTFILNF